MVGFGHFPHARAPFFQTHIRDLLLSKKRSKLPYSYSFRQSKTRIPTATTLFGDNLHFNLIFDINKTIILEDPAGSKTESDILNEILADCCWGKVTSFRDWSWSGLAPGQKPTAVKILPSKRCSKRKTMLSEADFGSYATYSDFLDWAIPDTADKLRENKRARDSLKGSFTHPGHPGELLSPEYANLENAIRLPETIKLHRWAKTAGLAERESYFLMPAFLECIAELYRQKVSFSLQFRTFGMDIGRVAAEFNAFCSGKHPLNDGVLLMDGSDGGLDYRIDLKHQKRFGSFYRNSSCTQLILGTLDQPSFNDHQKNSTEAFKLMINGVPSEQILVGYEEIWRFMATKFDGDHRTLALRDFYPHWRMNFERSEAGKLFLMKLAEPFDKNIDKSKENLLTSAQNNIHQIFFDDNIETEDFHIVDVKCLDNNLVPPSQEVLDKCLIKAEPYKCLMLSNMGNQNFFMMKILSLSKSKS